MFKPVNNNVVLLWDKPTEDVTIGGLIIPSSNKRGETAKVVAVNPQSELKVGDEVYFDKAKGTFTEVDGVQYLIIDEDDIFAVVE